MSKFVLDINEVGKKIGVPTKEVDMHGHVMQMPVWSVEDHLVPAIETAKEMVAAANADEIALTGQSDHWVLAAVETVTAEKLTEHIAGNGPMAVPAITMGEETAEGGIPFLTHTEGNTLYIYWDPDDPTKKGPGLPPHNYDVSKMPYVKVPVCTPDQDICITCNGPYGVIATVIRPYLLPGACRSFSISKGHGDDSGYICVLTNTAEKKIGDVTPYYRFD